MVLSAVIALTRQRAAVQVPLAKALPVRQCRKHEQDAWAKQTEPRQHDTDHRVVAGIPRNDGAQVRGEVEQGAGHGLRTG